MSFLVVEISVIEGSVEASESLKTSRSFGGFCAIDIVSLSTDLVCEFQVTV